MVRAALIWCGLPDPGETRRALREESDESEGGLLQLLHALAAADPDRKGMSSGQLLKAAREGGVVSNAPPVLFVNSTTFISPGCCGYSRPCGILPLLGVPGPSGTRWSCIVPLRQWLNPLLLWKCKLQWRFVIVVAKPLVTVDASMSVARMEVQTAFSFTKLASVVCWRCGSYGHYRSHCWSRGLKRCFACKKVGHIRPFCPSRAKVGQNQSPGGSVNAEAATVLTASKVGGA